MKKQKEQVRKHSDRAAAYDEGTAVRSRFAVYSTEYLTVLPLFPLDTSTLAESWCSEVCIFGNMQQSQQAPAELGRSSTDISTLGGNEA